MLSFVSNVLKKLVVNIESHGVLEGKQIHRWSSCCLCVRHGEAARDQEGLRSRYWTGNWGRGKSSQNLGLYMIHVD